MIMTYTGHLMTALGYIAGFIVLGLFWIWLVLVFAEAIARLWREFVIQCRLLALAFRASSPMRKRSPRSPKTLPAACRSSQLVDAPRGRPASIAGDAPAAPSTVESTPVAPATPAVSAEVASEGVPLFVIDAPLFQADPNVLEARPANLYEILEETCSAAKAAGYSDEEITRILADDFRFPGQHPSKT